MLPATCHTTDVMAWNSALRQVCGTFHAQPAQTHSLFIGDIVYRELAGIGFTLIRTNAGRIAGSPAHANAHCFLIYQVQGESWIEQGDIKCRLGQGELLLLDTISACEIVPEGLITHASIHLPRAELQQLLNHSGSLFRKLSCQTLSGRMLRDLIRQSCHDYLHEFGEQQGTQESLQQVLLTLVAASWQQSPHDDPAALPGSASTQQRWQCMQAFIDANLSNPQLSPDLIARHFSVSRRQVQRLFSLHGSTPAKYIQQERMKRIASSLRDPAFHDKNITELAFMWGFSDATWFSHAFKRAYGVSPSLWRRG